MCRGLGVSADGLHGPQALVNNPTQNEAEPSDGGEDGATFSRDGSVGGTPVL